MTAHHDPIAALPPKGDVTYLYALEFSNGVTKLGRSQAPRVRAQTTPVYFAKSHGKKERARVVRAVAFPMPTRGWIALGWEKEMLQRAAKVATLITPFREYFLHLPFGAAANLARQFAGRERIEVYEPFRLWWRN